MNSSFLMMFLALLLLGCTVPPPAVDGEQTLAATVPAGAEIASATGIVDGDTIDVNLGGQGYRVRYIGVNTPEHDQPCYEEATDANRALVENQTVTLVKDVSETDRYGRLLRYVYVGDTFVNAELVRSGYAEAATYPPDVQFADLFVQLAGEARTANLGCWSANPWGAAAPTPASGAACDCSGNLYNCSEFPSRSDAQACFDSCVAQGKGDVHGLDANNDGAACETLP